MMNAGIREHHEADNFSMRAVSAGGWRRHVLLLEDDAPLRSFIEWVLQGNGYQVIEVRDGVELLKDIALEGDVHRRGRAEHLVVVVDISSMMHGFTRPDALAVLRRACAMTSVILITAFAGEEIRREARGLRAAALLDQPFDVEDLRVAVDELAA